MSPSPLRAPPFCEPLEARQMLSAKKYPARVTSMYIDNRGMALFAFNYPLNASSLTNKNVSFYSAGADKKLGTSDDERVKTGVSYSGGILKLTAGVTTDAACRISLKKVVDANGFALDGEFAGMGNRSGDGNAGGYFDVIAEIPSNSTTYRYITNKGNIVVNLFNTTKKTKKNFQWYADKGYWDTTIFHRSTRDSISGIQVVQGGGFNIQNGKDIGSVPQAGGIGLELGRSNLKGTIAMARTNDVNSNTNQWFFNVNDNTALDTIGGGYTVFGQVADANSQATIEAINNLTIRKGDPSTSNSPFNELPCLDATGTIDVPADLVTVSRVSRLMNIRAVGASTQAVSAGSVAAAPTTATKKRDPNDVLATL